MKLVVRRSVTISAMAALMSACAVSEPISVNTTVINLQTASSVEFPAAEASNGLRSQWRTALSNAFNQRSVGIQKDAPFIVDFALSIRRADTGVADVGATAENVEWQSEPRENRFLDRCRTQKLRGTLVIFRRDDGEIIYRGESEADDCKFDQSAIDLMADQLVSKAVGG